MEWSCVLLEPYYVLTNKTTIVLLHICQENVDYATEKVSRFKESSQWYDPLTFCDPVFQVGNGLLMTPGSYV